MLDYYIEIFEQIGVQFVELIPIVLGVFLVVKLTSDLLFKD
jgi:hypothetical protein